LIATNCSNVIPSEARSGIDGAVGLKHAGSGLCASAASHKRAQSMMAANARTMESLIDKKNQQTPATILRNQFVLKPTQRLVSAALDLSGVP
jgi:hypothetical protein